MPSFFANPFMTPFMPQQQHGPILNQQVLPPPPPAPSSSLSQQQNLVASGDYRINPLSSADNCLLSNMHYQEFMQQYIQNLIAAASRLPTYNSVDSSSFNQVLCLFFFFLSSND